LEDQEITDKINNDLLASNKSFPEQLSNDIKLADSSPKSSVKNLPNVPVISTTSDIPLVENSHDMNSVDR